VHLKFSNEGFKIVEHHQYTVEDGLPNNIIYGVYEDDYDHLWLSSNNGIIRFNKSSHFSFAFTEKHGISHREFSRISHFQKEDGTLFFGGLNGVTSFHPKDFQHLKEEINIPLEISKYELYDNRQNKRIDKTTDLNHTNTITLHPYHRSFNLEVVLLDYQDINQIRYSYQIIGHSEEWIYLDGNNLRMSGLPYGKYTLNIRGQGSMGRFSTQQLSIPIIVKYPFYFQWWFILLIVGNIIGSVFFWYKRRTTQLKRRQKELETIVKERTEELEKDKATIEMQTKELQEIDATKSRFFANVSHELRTPITLIQGPIQSILNSQDLNNRNSNLLSIAKQNAKKLLQLVNEILDLTKLDGHKLALEETTVVLYTFLRQIMSNFQSVADSQSIEFIFNYHPPHTLQIKIDKSKFEKILNNLLSNAFKFTPKNGRIELSVEELGAFGDYQNILVTVKDNGRGIPSEDVPNVFNRFYQSSINKKAEGGLGIGLALSMEFVKAMKSKMWAESSTDAIHHGSTFFLQFPKNEVFDILSTEQQLLIQEEETAVINTINQNDTTPKTNETIPNNISETTILVVEDNADLRDYLSLILSPYYNVITAENGEEGLERLTVDGGRQTVNPQPSSDERTSIYHPPSLIISDVMMPIMDGFEFLEKVKANPQWSSLPFIMLTAHAEIQTKLKALRIGVDDYILKPFEEEELLVRIANLLANYDERRAFTQTETSDKTDVISIPIISEEDQKWLADVENIVLKEMNNSLLSVDYLSELLYMHRTTFYKKIRPVLNSVIRYLSTNNPEWG